MSGQIINSIIMMTSNGRYAKARESLGRRPVARRLVDKRRNRSAALLDSAGHQQAAVELAANRQN